MSEEIAGTAECLVVWDGDLDFESAATLRARLAQLLERGNKDLVVDLSHSTYVDSSGMLTLVAAAHRALAAGGTLRLKNPPRILAKMLRLSHLGEALGFPAEDTPKARKTRFVDTGVGQWEVSRLVVPAKAKWCGAVRRAVLEEAAATPLDGEDRADLELAVGEAFANAVRHGTPGGEQDLITVRTLRGADAFIVEITDTGAGFDRNKLSLPKPEEIREGGMGIFYMETLMDQVEFDSVPQGTTVRLLKSYPSGQPSASGL